MKRKICLLFTAIFLSLLLCMPVSAAAKKKTTGWKTASNGTVFYYKKGKKVKGFVRIGGVQYYFNRKGRLLKDAWIIKNRKVYRTDSAGRVIKKRFIHVNGNTYYMKWNGVRKTGWMDAKNGKRYFNYYGIMVTGLQTIGGSQYYFNSDGNLQTGEFTVNSSYYTADENGVISTIYTQNGDGSVTGTDGNGNALSSAKIEEWKALRNAKAVVASITNDSMTKSQKIQACFNWVMRKPYATLRRFSNFEGWPATYANDHFEKGRGNCQSDAAAFAYLCKALGCTGVYVCADSDGSWGLAHSWTEVEGRYYDPLFAESKGYSKYYAAASYSLPAILHIQIA